MQKMSIYLDVCALCRPFDDQAFLRIRLETEAMNIIMSKIQDRHFTMAISTVHYAEIKAIPDQMERLELLSIIEQFGKLLDVDKAAARKRAEELFSWGFGAGDSAHLAYAEAGKAKFITCDDKLVKKCGKYKINTWYGNPVQFCVEEDLR